MKTLFLAFCLLSTCASVRADNLLKNASFETAGSSADTAANWNRWGDWMNRETSWAPTHGGQCLIGYHHWEVANDNNSGLWQDVTTVTPGQKFKFSAFVFVDDSGSGHAAQKIELRLEAIRDGHEVTINSVSQPVADLPKDSKWHELSVTGTTPEKNIRVLVVITPGANPHGGAIKIDDADLELVK